VKTTPIAQFDTSLGATGSLALEDPPGATHPVWLGGAHFAGVA
jgi:hypothetical protein